jgi:integrase
MTSRSGTCARRAPALGLLVMRRAGLRLGELRRLERDCVRRDHAGGAFLKVPLGKMNNERLVPLDAKALDTIRLLQEMANRDSRWLVEGARERPMSAGTYVRALARLSAGISLPEPLTLSHRLRHTFASSLINGGMSLLGIMKLLGYRDQRMTLRYTAIADATVGREYFEALTRISERYELPPDPGEATSVDVDPKALLEGAIAWITKHYGVGAGPFHHRARLLARRLEAAKDDLQQLRLEAQDRGLE